jgi:hypothetical protein
VQKLCQQTRVKIKLTNLFIFASKKSDIIAINGVVSDLTDDEMMTDRQADEWTGKFLFSKTTCKYTPF